MGGVAGNAESFLEFECYSNNSSRVTLYLKSQPNGLSSQIPPSRQLHVKVNNKNTRTRFEIPSKLTVKTPGVLIVNFEHISHLVLVIQLLTLRR